MKRLIYIPFLLLSLSSQGQSLTSKQLHEDLLQLQSAIETFNPALNTYNPNFDAEVGKLLDQVPSDSVSLIEAFQYISQMSALSNEGHFDLGNWSDEVHSGFISNQYKYMPISIKLINGKAFVWLDNSTEQALNQGDEILSINGLKTKGVLENFYQVFPSDGNITTYIDKNIEFGFSWMYYLYISQPDVFTLEVKNKNGLVKNHSIQALHRDVQFDNYALYYPDRATKKEDAPSFHQLNFTDDVAYLALPSFDYRKIKEQGIKSKQFYKSIFKEIDDRQVKNLVIDLRGNTGGRNELADDMVPYILKESAQAPYLKKTISWEGKEKTYALPKPSKLSFEGNVYVLVDGKTYSAGNTLARYLFEFADATIIGEETGARYEGFAAGSKEYITLQNSQFSIGIPRYHIVFPKSERQTTINRGLKPHVDIECSIDDLIEEKDLHLEKANFLIEQG